MKQLESIFKALAEETRLRILALLFRHGPVCVCEVEGLQGITQSKASRHLRYMANAGLLESERDGVTVNYRLPANPSAELAALLVVLRGILATRDSGDPHAEAGVLAQLRLSRSGQPGAAAPVDG